MRPKTTIFEIAEKAFTPRNQINCSGYVRDVINLAGDWVPDEDANHLIQYMQTSPSWTDLGNDDVRASELAGQHYLVIAGLLNKHGHGHVVLIVPGRENGYAKGYWGSLNNAHEAYENAGIDHAFTRAELPEVQYFAIPVGSLKPSP